MCVCVCVCVYVLYRGIPLVTTVRPCSCSVQETMSKQQHQAGLKKDITWSAWSLSACKTVHYPNLGRHSPQCKVCYSQGVYAQLLQKVSLWRVANIFIDTKEVLRSTNGNMMFMFQTKISDYLCMHFVFTVQDFPFLTHLLSWGSILPISMFNLYK